MIEGWKNTLNSKTQDWFYLIFIYWWYNSVTISCSVTTSDYEICRYVYIYHDLEPFGLYWIVRLYCLQKPPQDVFCKKRCFENFTGNHLCWKLFLIKFFTSLRACNFNKKKQETPTQLFSCEICEMFQNTYNEEHRNDCF